MTLVIPTKKGFEFGTDRQFNQAPRSLLRRDDKQYSQLNTTIMFVKKTFNQINKS